MVQKNAVVICNGSAEFIKPVFAVFFNIILGNVLFFKFNKNKVEFRSRIASCKEISLKKLKQVNRFCEIIY